MSDPRGRVTPPVRPRAASGLIFVAGLMLGGWSTAGGCSLHQEGVRPPDNRIFFPGGAMVENGGRWLYVVNSNSDLRYNAGTLIAVDLERVRQDYEGGMAWGDCPADTRFVPRANVSAENRCCRDHLNPGILNCDEQEYVRRESTVRIGSFGGRPVMQQLAAGRRRMFMPVRGDTSIGMVEVSVTPATAAEAEKVEFLCTGPRRRFGEEAGQEQFAACDEQWRVNQINDPGAIELDVPENQIVRLPDEPYALAVDDVLQLLYVGHLRGGNVSLIDLGDGDNIATPNLVTFYGGLLPGDGNGSQGVTSVTIKAPGCFGTVYVASRFRPVVGSFVVYGDTCAPPGDPSRVGRALAIVGTGQILGTGLPTGSETRGIEFAQKKFAAAPECQGDTPHADCAPDRAFILQRLPPALVAIDATTLAPFATVEVCQSPTNLAQHIDANGRTQSLFVTCYDAGEVYVIDPWAPRVRAIIPVGRGPIATVLPPADSVGTPTANRGYVVGFGGNNVVVIDLNPDSPTGFTAIQRIGFSSPTPREVGAR